MAAQPAPAIEEILQAFEGLKKAVIDTSSIIYTRKAGYFPVLGETIQLYSIPEVISEIKTAGSGIRVIDPPGSSSLTTDRKLVACALENRMTIPLISRLEKPLPQKKNYALP